MGTSVLSYLRYIIHIHVTLLSKHKTFVYHLYNVGPTSSTLVQHCTNVIQMFRVCWVITRTKQQRSSMFRIVSIVNSDQHRENVYYVYLRCRIKLRVLANPGLACEC